MSKSTISFYEIRMAKKITVLTPEEDAAWENAFVCSKDSGMTDLQADAQAWREVQQEFPRLREFDGCKA